MSSSSNPLSDSPKSSNSSLSKPNPSEQPSAPTPDQKTAQTVSSSHTDSSANPPDPSAVERQQPIPPPSEPKQYRAIGLVRGQYAPSAEQITRGALMASDGTPINAVLLGRVMSLVKNHIDLQQNHLWVVYPRTGQYDGNLHVQIVGVWEPETLNEEYQQDEDSEASASSNPPQTLASSEVDDNYFSVRGEVIFHAQQKEYLVVKIKQSPRKQDDKPKFFKLKLNGPVSGKVVGHFWEFHVRRQGNDLEIQESHNMGAMPPRRKPKNNFRPSNKRRFGGGYQRSQASPPVTKDKSHSDRPSGTPKPKPIKPPQKK